MLNVLVLQLSILAFSVNFLGKIELKLLSKSTWQLAVLENDTDTRLGKGLNFELFGVFQPEGEKSNYHFSNKLNKRTSFDPKGSQQF